jgi:hypothetical protein
MMCMIPNLLRLAIIDDHLFVCLVSETYVLAYLILTIRRARVDRRRPATHLIVSRSCARITPGRPIEPEKFDRRRRLLVVSMETVVATMVCSITQCFNSVILVKQT